MTIDDRFILYSPPKTQAPSRGAAPNTPGVWQGEMLDWLSLFDDGDFQAVPAQHAGRATEVPTDEAKAFVQARDGVVLDAGRVLKFDQHPKIHQGINLKDQPRINGSPNFRGLPPGPDGPRSIYGTAQPTIEGIRNVLDETTKDGKTACWTSLREEPVVYINGKPLNLRERMFNNLENPGADGKDVERTEALLKQDVLREAARNGGRVLVHDETPEGRIVARWKTVTPESVQTTREVFDMLKQEGYKVDYARIPVTDEKRPEEKDFDALVTRLKDVPDDAAMIFNCHAGRGRTTTGMVAAGLMRRAKEGGSEDESIKRSRPVHEDIREQGKYKRGEYKVILGMIDVLEQGPKSKAEADSAIDQFSSLQNLREDIETYKNKADDTKLSAADRQKARDRGHDYLERYFYLIAFDAYAKDQAGSGFQKPFSEWMDEHRDLRGLLGRVELAMGFPSCDGNQTAYA